ncbi:MAG: hypothetical protein ACREK1_03685 [Longimicrobiales bacterium]
MRALSRFLTGCFFLLLAACTADEQGEADTAAADAEADTAMTPLAEQYVRLVLAVGGHDDGYVDAYYGPAEWREQVAAEQLTLDSIAQRAQRLIGEVTAVELSGASELVQLRKGYLARQLDALSSYVRMLQGVRQRGWPEYSVYPLFSPQSLIAEGSANYGIDVAFPGAERVEFERNVLFPLAGIDPARADEYERVRLLVERLSYAGNEAARAYLNGTISGDSAATWLNTYALLEPARAQQRVRFFDAYRSYVINYNYGRDLVAEYVLGRGGTADDPARRWEVLKELLSTPRLPSDLR